MSAEFAELVLDASPMVAIVREARGHWPVVYVSEAIIQFGYSALELEEQRTSFKDLIHPLDRDTVSWSLQTAMDSSADYFTDSYRVITASGESRWVSDWTTISRDGEGRAQQTTTLLLDTTKQHDTEAAFQDIAETLPGALFQYRLYPNGTDAIEYVNPGCADIWELDMARLRHDPTLLWDAVLEEDATAMQHSVMVSFQSLQMWEHEWRIQTASGVKWLRARGRPRKLEDGSVRWHTIILDVTSSKTAQEGLENSLKHAVHVLAQVTEARDSHVAGHHHRVAQSVKLIGEAMGLGDDQIEGLTLAASVHDIGEMFIPQELIAKPGPLTHTEYQQVQFHAEAGAGLLEQISVHWPLEQIVLQHHERMDGSGYPRGLRGEDILLEARILAVAEVIDAMSSPRPYREALDETKVREELATGRGRLYDEVVVDTALRLLDDGALADILPVEQNIH
ncbi:MAG: HD domain-containing phosphohydrolase [Halieaceae bacterium]|jgi:PAS domain S-box-containing protein|nr:HD domain-containing phosphohydrolase [Halieaceae bacterium]